MVTGDRLSEAITRQLASNRSAAGHQEHFAGHRARLTREIASRAPEGGHGRLALLGAGNANDVDLDALAGLFAEIHLVDIDPEAVRGAVARASQAHRRRLLVHAPLDVSGVFDRLEPWSRALPGAGVIAGEAELAVQRVVGALPGPFEVVVSCCLLTQLQLVLLEVVGDRNPGFEALRAAVSRIHVRTLARLLAPCGTALLVTDLVSSRTYPLEALTPDADLSALMGDLIHAGNVIHSSHPGLLSAEIRREHALRAAYSVRPPVGPWIWHNGPEKTFLVYALEIVAAAPRVPRALE